MIEMKVKMALARKQVMLQIKYMPSAQSTANDITSVSKRTMSIKARPRKSTVLLVDYLDLLMPDRCKRSVQMTLFVKDKYVS